MSSTGESSTPPCTHSRKRCADAAQKEAEMKKRPQTTSQLRKIQGALPNSGMVNLIGRNDILVNSKNRLKIKIEEEADVDVKLKKGGDEMPNDEETECSPTATAFQNQIGVEILVKEEVHLHAQVSEEEVGTNFPEETRCVRCQGLEKLAAEKDLRVKEMEQELESLKHKHHYDITVSKLIAEVDEEDNEALGGKRKNKTTPIFLPILEGKSKEEIQRLVEGGEEWDVPNADRNTVFHVAAKVGSSELIEYFISISDKPDVNTKNSSGRTPLMEAAKSAKNFLEVFNVLVKNRAYLQTKDLEGNNVLHVAIAAGRSEKEIEKIIMSTPNWNCSRTINGNTVFHVATKSGNLEALKYFLSLGPDFVKHSINSTNFMSETPLMTATRADQNFLPIVYLLQKNGAYITSRNNWGEDVICYAIKNRRTSEDLEFLITAGATWNTRRPDGKSILHVCAEHGHVEALWFFIRKGANVNAVDIIGDTPVMLAARCKKSDAMKFLIEKGAAFEASALLERALLVDCRKPLGQYEGLLKTIKTISELGATLDDASRVKIFHECVQHGNLEGVRYFIMNGMGVNVKDTNGLTPLMKAIAGSLVLRVEVFDFLMEMGADVEAVDMNGFSVLHLAIRSDSCYLGTDRFLEIFQKLIQRGASWNTEVVGQEPHQESILHAAVRRGSPEVVQYFISKGVNVNARNAMGDTPFLHAVRKNVSKLGEILRALVNGGADPNAVDNEGNTALLVGTTVMFEREYSRQERQLSQLKLLVALGCDSRIPNEKGETVLSVLKDHGKFHYLKYFKSPV